LALALSEPVGNGKRDCHTDDEHEERLYQIPEMKSVPFMMVELGSYEMEDSIVGAQKEGEEMSGLTSKEEHCEAAEEVDRSNSAWKGRAG